MSRVNYNVLSYTRTMDASDEDAARARSLLIMRLSSYSKTDREARTAKGQSIETVQDLATKYDNPAEHQRFAPPAKAKNLRNREFLAAMIMDGEGRSNAVPPIWRVPVDLPVGRKRGSCGVALPAPSINGSVQPEVTSANVHLKFDPSIHSVSRYVDHNLSVWLLHHQVTDSLFRLQSPATEAVQQPRSRYQLPF